MMKFKKYCNKDKHICLMLLLVGIGILTISVETNAKEMSQVIGGKLLELDKDSDNKIEELIQQTPIGEETFYGEFSIEGNINPIKEENGISAFEVLDDNVNIIYKLNNTYMTQASDEWHLIDNNRDSINGENIGGHVGSGAVIVQTSLNGNDWITDTVYRNIRKNEVEFNKEIYTSKDIQQVNGCYYRILVSYKVEKEEEVDKSITNWLGTEKEDKEYVELYKFYLIDKNEHSNDETLASSTPRKELGSKINTGKDNGYSGNEGINNKDPHYGWDIGTFFVNGYTRETSNDAGTPIFLKNVGDKVTLWFSLNQEIDCLNNKDNLSVSMDINGHDEKFEVDKTNFKRGALIIRYTDHEGKVHEPTIYTDYLAANAITGANTKVELFQEGDYEVALNYEILDNSGINSYTNYKIEFEFSIRNGNCMVYPFDTLSGAELINQNITENGFRLDMAKSRYLTIDVVKELVKKGESGYITDERFNKPAKDGEIYSDEGIYTFTVKNLYTDSEPITKVIYVGSSPEIRAMASGNTIDSLNQVINEGGKLQEDGSFILVGQEECVGNSVNTNEELEQNKNDKDIDMPNSLNEESGVDENSNESSVEVLSTQTKVNNTKGLGFWIAIIVTVGLVIVGVSTIYIVKHGKNRNR